MFNKIKSNISSVKDKVEKAFLDNISIISSKIEAYAKEVGTKLDDIWEDDAELTKLLAVVHGLMPLPFQFIVREERFILVCIKSKELLKEQINKPK